MARGRFCLTRAYHARIMASMPPSAQVVKVVLFSGFPPRFTQSSIVNRLAKHGVKVIEVGDPKKVHPRGFAQADAILVMNEMMGHADDLRIRNLAAQHEKRIFYLSRKAAMWPHQLAALLPNAPAPQSEPEPPAPKEEPMPPAALAVVPPPAPTTASMSPFERVKASGQVEAFLRRIQQLAEEGKSYRIITLDTKLLAPWLGDLSMDSHKLGNLVQHIVSAGLAPDDFVEWRKSRDNRAGKSTPNELAEMETLANDYAQENAKLKTTIESLTDKCAKLEAMVTEHQASAARLNQENRALNEQINRMQEAEQVRKLEASGQPAASAAKLGDALRSIDTLADLGALDTKAAVAMLRKLLDVPA